MKNFCNAKKTIKVGNATITELCLLLPSDPDQDQELGDPLAWHGTLREPARELWRACLRHPLN
jgi:hypothetical protein